MPHLPPPLVALNLGCEDPVPASRPPCCAAHGDGSDHVSDPGAPPTAPAAVGKAKRERRLGFSSLHFKALHPAGIVSYLFMMVQPFAAREGRDVEEIVVATPGLPSKRVDAIFFAPPLDPLCCRCQVAMHKLLKTSQSFGGFSNCAHTLRQTS